jgi:spore germination cell wall hydrolase CwlJ-like protein
MYLRPAYLAACCGWTLRNRWYGVRARWYTFNAVPWIAALIAGLLIAGFVAALRAVETHREHRTNLLCLARNVYFEARGESLRGQHAVAEVTMNRVASGAYPGTVCGVVYQKNWDPLRGRYVGAFSWTEFDAVPAPAGREWLRAWRAAEAVYYGEAEPVVEGALFYHASSIKPSWARGKKPLARIGGHVFYN